MTGAYKRLHLLMSEGVHVCVVEQTLPASRFILEPSLKQEHGIKDAA
jgi:hypothetical protein